MSVVLRTLIHAYVLQCVALPTSERFSTTTRSNPLRLEQAESIESNQAGDIRICDSDVSPERIAVIGGGIGGSAASYFLSQLPGRIEGHKTCTESRTVVVYEATDTIGGRTAVHDFHGHRIEIGGSIFHEKNLHMMGWCDEFGLTKKKASSTDGGKPGTVGVWDGEMKRFQFKTSEFKIVTMIKVLWRYGLSPIRMNHLVAAAADLFSKFYSSVPWSTVPDGLEATGLTSYVATIAQEWLKSKSISDVYADEILTGIVRSVYLQNLSMHTLGMLIAAIGSNDQNLYSVKGGNRLIAEQLLQRSGATVKMETRVTSIRKCSTETDKICISTQDEAASEYDAVIIATPLENANIVFGKIGSNGNDTQTVSDTVFRTFRTVHTTLVVGRLNPQYFGVSHVNEIPTDVMTTESVAQQDFSSLSDIGIAKSDDSNIHSKPIYKMFSRKPIGDKTLALMFVEVVDVYRHTWTHAYPVLYPNPEFPPVRLGKSIFYVNAFESVVSCMECSAISAHNVAQLVVSALGLTHQHTITSMRNSSIKLDATTLPLYSGCPSRLFKEIKR
eukprot:CFRG3817T1